MTQLFHTVYFYDLLKFLLSSITHCHVVLWTPSLQLHLLSQTWGAIIIRKTSEECKVNIIFLKNTASVIVKKIISSPQLLLRNWKQEKNWQNVMNKFNCKNQLNQLADWWFNGDPFLSSSMSIKQEDSCKLYE